MVNFYGIMFAIGALFAYRLALREAKHDNLDIQVVENLFFYLLLGGIIGARLGYIFLYWPDGIKLTILETLKVWRGGLAFYGGFVGAVVAGLLFIKIRKLNFWQYADAFTIPLIVGHIFGRIGDYLTGGHPGKPTDLPWAIFLNDELRHPVVLYEITGLGIILTILIILRRRKIHVGLLFTTYVGLYAAQRLFLDIYRIESTDPRYLGLTPSQYIAIGFIAFSITMLILFSFRRITIVSDSYRSSNKRKRASKY